MGRSILFRPWAGVDSAPAVAGKRLSGRGPEAPLSGPARIVLLRQVRRWLSGRGPCAGGGMSKRRQDIAFVVAQTYTGGYGPFPIWGAAMVHPILNPGAPNGGEFTIRAQIPRPTFKLGRTQFQRKMQLVAACCGNGLPGCGLFRKPASPRKSSRDFWDISLNPGVSFLIGFHKNLWDVICGDQGRQPLP